jgi:hypothetical protein
MLQLAISHPITVFVCWDPDLIPSIISEPAQYPAARDPVTFGEITDNDRLEYFARYTNTSLGRVKNLYLDWARLKGPMSAECQELNRLFSTCVDGNRIKVPPVLEELPHLPSKEAAFILDTLHKAAKDLINDRRRSESYDGYSFDAMELLLCRDDIAMSEFELVRLTYHWCLKKKADLADFLHLFDFNRLSDIEKSWILKQLPPVMETPALIRNGLLQSNLVDPAELRSFRLDHHGLRWKCIFDSTTDRLGAFLDVVSRTLELFHRKLIIIHVNDRFTVAIFVPQKIERRRECQVDDKVLLFAFPHSQGVETSQRRVVPTKVKYRLYCDGNVFQLFEEKRRNTWVFITRGASDDGSYRNTKNTGDRRRQRQITLDEGVNYDCRVSIALQKFSAPMQKHVGAVNRNGILAAVSSRHGENVSNITHEASQEIYVISNRDIHAMQTLDLWLQQIDTEERLPLFDRKPREYVIPKIADVDWPAEPEELVRVVKHRDFVMLREFRTEEQYRHLFHWLREKSELELLHQIFKYLVNSLRENFVWMDPSAVVLEMIQCLSFVPNLAIHFASIGTWGSLRPDLHNVLLESALNILRAIVLSANEMQVFVVAPFKEILSQMQHMTLQSFLELVELIALSVHLPEIALDLFFGCLEPQTTRVLTGRPSVIRFMVRNAFGIALDHIDESSPSQNQGGGLLNLKYAERASDPSILHCRLRLDVPSVGALTQGDHIRLTAASAPVNAPTARIISMDAQVLAYEPGLSKIRCLHPPPRFVEDCSWALQNCGSFVTSKAMLDAVRAFVTRLNDCCGIYQQILGLPSDDRNLCSSQFTARDDLNASQNKAVQSSLSFPFTCLWGPPGTGKTHTLVMISHELLMSKSRPRILVSAPTHNAVDNIMRKFLKEVGGNGGHYRTLRVSTDVRPSNDLALCLYFHDLLTVIVRSGGYPKI